MFNQLKHKTMTFETIKNSGWSPVDLYAKLVTIDASPIAATLGELNELEWTEQTLVDTEQPDSPLTTQQVETKTNYFSVLFAKACVDSICSAYKRNDPMTDAEKMQTAEQIVDNYPFLTIYDIKDFDLKLTAGRIPVNGNDYSITAVDRGSIMARLKSYCELFTKRTYSSDLSKQDKIVPLGARGSWERTHDAYGNFHPSGWNADAWWQEWRRTHNWDFVNSQWVEAEYRKLDEAIEYWNRLLPQEEKELVSDRVCRLPKKYAWS